MSYLNGDEEALAKAESASQALSRLRKVEFALVVLVLLLGMATAGLSLSLSARVKDCTVRGGKCYEENRRGSLGFRQDVLTRLDVLEEHLKSASDCLTLQLLQHRDSNEIAHKVNADFHGYKYQAPQLESPPPIPQQLSKACTALVEGAKHK